MEHLIELKDVYKIYQMGTETVHALDGINLTIDEGEFVAIVGQSHPLQRADRPLVPLVGGDAGVEKGEFHIFLHSELGDQIVLLKDESQHLVADLGLLVVVHGGYIHAAQMIGPGSRHIQAADDVHGGGLA